MQRLRQFINQIAPLTDSTWEVVSALFTPTTLRKNEYFALAGRVETTAAYVTQGVLRGFYRHANGLEYNKTFFVDNDFVGAYSSLVTGQPNQIYIQALTDCELFSADYSALTRLYQTHPDWERFARCLAEGYFVYKEKRELELVLFKADERYVRFREEYPMLEQVVAQYHVASYLGITPTQLSRIRAKVFHRS
ncbi:MULTISPECIES: Crp/Fnr family transcriptional regulator [Spirosoma]|uniref:Crp/Fnr family transcriptional regulator n=1 Tax=Spirosoma sordidisoli TaxID=2502893 RepID=A0A4Q2UJQ2_9BACT|nr:MULTISPECIES: Crp/Fnr family transcriptional regulator [Spirosoma]RYC69727.1 Crp/Fnr family transcriptional regulator [Spirosoma sordidisoli]